MENQFHIKVDFSKKLHQKTYHLATFKEPLTRNQTDSLPAHIIEKPDPPVQKEEEQPQNQRRRQEEPNWQIRYKGNAPEKKHPIFLYEEHTATDPTKFYGYRDNYKSANAKTKVPNYALMIYDVRLIFLNLFFNFRKQKGNLEQSQQRTTSNLRSKSQQSMSNCKYSHSQVLL